ncbi:MAG: HTH-type transcriptional regulator YesS [Firmicutes bacterium ADurb.Bin182]|nr:MAG: HTH-type transcriptional regulator YesS [Firmicutes bacterium ADurb.Bin182]
MKNQPKFKLRIIVTLSILLAVLLLLSTIVVSFMLKGLITKQIVENGRNTAAQLQSSVEQILEVMNNSLVQISLDTEVQSFSDRLDLLNIFDCESVYERLYRFRATNQYIDKLYVCYYQDGMVIDLNGIDARMTSIEKLSDKDIIDAAVERCLSERFQKIFTVYNIAEPGEDTLLVATKPAPPMASVPRAVIVVTVKQSYFQEVLQAISLEDERNIFVLDENGRFLFGKDSRQPIFSIDGARETVSTGSEDNVVVSIKSQETGWNYVYEIPKHQIRMQVNGIMMWLWIIAVAMLFTAFIGARFLAEELYKPVRKVINTIGGYEAPSSVRHDEMSFINENIKTMMAEKKQAEKLVEENKPFLRDDALHKLITIEDADETAILERFNNYDVSYIPNAWYCTVILSVRHLDALSKHYSEMEINTILLYVMEKIREVANGYDNVEMEFIRGQESRKMVLLFSLNIRDENTRNKTLGDILNDIFKKVTNDIGVAVSIGVGNVRPELSSVWKSYQEANSAYQYRIIAGDNTIIYANELPEIEKRGFVYPFKLENKLFDAIKHNDRAAIDEAFGKFIEYIRKNAQATPHISHLAVQILNDTLNFLQERSIDSSMIFGDLNSIFDDIMKLDTIDAIETYFKDIFNNISDYIINRKTQESSSLSGKIIAFIDANYRNEEVCLDVLARKLYFSVSHIVKVFKNATGKSIKEYITEKRIAEAKDLLSSGNVKIRDVARHVGYSNVRSFINIFKKYTGFTPGDYKDEVLRGSDGRYDN